MTESYEGSHQQYGVAIETDTMIPMRDGVRLATDIYFPAAGGKKAAGPFPVVLERTPYGKSTPGKVLQAKYFARRGYVCAYQDVRGRFGSEGEWYPFAREANDGYDAVEWLGTQAWSSGKVGTMGDSYAGSDQGALATLNPPHLSAMLIAVGASNYYHSSMRQNGALEQRFLIYTFRMAITSKEAAADANLRKELIRQFTHNMPDIVRRFPLKKGATILKRLPSYEQWAIDILTRGDYDDYWKMHRGYAISEYYEEHADVPSLYLGGWYDSYARNTCESYIALRKMKSSPQHLLMGPWTHAKYEIPYAGDVDFGLEAQIEYKDLKLAWFDRFLKGMRSEAAGWAPVRIFTMGGGDGKRTIAGAPGDASEYPGRIRHGGCWKEYPDWPLPGTGFTPYYLQTGGGLSPDKPAREDLSHSRYTFDPKDPVPTIGGGVSAADSVMKPGAFDQVGRPDSLACSDCLPLNCRADILTFETAPLGADTEVTGPIEMHLWAASSAVDTDFTAKLIDVYPPNDDHPQGLAINITDSIIRARYRNGYDKPEPMTPGNPYEFIFDLYPTSNIFKEGHRIRLDISSSNWPRFDVNPNTGGPLGLESRFEVAHQAVYHDSERPSHVVLPVQPVQPVQKGRKNR
ncbi:MAG: CocE/NonD family hydrolase [Desulfobacteraceae bacterium]|nr:MAG: CocE/NonD family hydrolase [Desulfobacteraceae bacterium]